MITGQETVNGLSFLFGVLTGVLLVCVHIFFLWQIMIYKKTKMKNEQGSDDE